MLFFVVIVAGNKDTRGAEVGPYYINIGHGHLPQNHGNGGILFLSSGNAAHNSELVQLNTAPQHVAVPVPQSVPVTLLKAIPIPQHLQFALVKHVPVPVPLPHNSPYPVPQTYPFHYFQTVPVHVPEHAIPQPINVELPQHVVTSSASAGANAVSSQNSLYYNTGSAGDHGENSQRHGLGISTPSYDLRSTEHSPTHPGQNSDNDFRQSSKHNAAAPSANSFGSVHSHNPGYTTSTILGQHTGLSAAISSVHNTNSNVRSSERDTAGSSGYNSLQDTRSNTGISEHSTGQGYSGTASTTPSYQELRTAPGSVAGFLVNNFGLDKSIFPGNFGYKTGYNTKHSSHNKESVAANSGYNALYSFGTLGNYIGSNAETSSANNGPANGPNRKPLGFSLVPKATQTSGLLPEHNGFGHDVLLNTATSSENSAYDSESSIKTTAVSTRYAGASKAPFEHISSNGGVYSSNISLYNSKQSLELTTTIPSRHVEGSEALYNSQSNQYIHYT